MPHSFLWGVLKVAVYTSMVSFLRNFLHLIVQCLGWWSYSDTPRIPLPLGRGLACECLKSQDWVVKQVQFLRRNHHAAGTDSCFTQMAMACRFLRAAVDGWPAAWQVANCNIQFLSDTRLLFGFDLDSAGCKMRLTFHHRPSKTNLQSTQFWD